MSAPLDEPFAWQNPNLSHGEGGAREAQALQRGARLRSQLRRGQALGTFLIDLPNRNTVGAIGRAGFDFVVIDMEHSSIDFASLESLIVAAHAASLVALVRPWSCDAGLIGKILDLGAHGIMAPHIDTPERARHVVDQARFPPRGRRGFSPLSKFDALQEPLKALGDDVFVVAQVEGQSGLGRAREIAATPGLDALFVGPYDLALSMSVAPGSDAVFEAAEHLAGSLPQGLFAGLYIDDPKLCARWLERGFRLQCVGFDGRLFADAARSLEACARVPAPLPSSRRQGG